MAAAITTQTHFPSRGKKPLTYNVQASPTPVSRLKSPHSLHLGETQPVITITHPDRRSSTASSVLPTRPSPFPSSNHRERGQNLGRISPAYAEGAGSRCRLPQRTRGPNANFLRTPFLWSACELFFILGLSVL